MCKLGYILLGLLVVPSKTIMVRLFQTDAHGRVETQGLLRGAYVERISKSISHWCTLFYLVLETDSLESTELTHAACEHTIFDFATFYCIYSKRSQCGRMKYVKTFSLFEHMQIQIYSHRNPLLIS